jgi:uncharacterized membrane protein SpoIIM required for sporulation
VNAARLGDWTLAPVHRLGAPTGIDVKLTIAGPGARAYAFAIDWVIRFALATAWIVLGSLAINGDLSFAPSDERETLWFLAAVLPSTALYFLYHPLLECILRGRTPGKRFAGLRIVASDGRAATLGALLLRNVFRLVDSLPVVYSVGLAAVYMTRRHVRFGDLAAGTLLVYDRQHDAPRDTPTDSVDGVLDIIEHYRAAARAVSLARTRLGDATPVAVEAAYGRLHAEVHALPQRPYLLLLSVFRDQIPAAMHAMRTHLIWVTLWFVLCILAGGWLVHTYPDLIALFASSDMIATVERGELWTDGLLNVTPSSVLSIELLTNNIIVALFCFAAGFLFGLGTLYIIGTNGLLLGAVFAFTAQHGLEHRLFEFITAHGPVELSCICIAGAAGAYAGDALARPTGPSRSASFAVACAASGRVLLAVTLLLFGCGFIEGYLSPDPDIPMWTRLVVGWGYFLFMIALLRGYLLGRSRDRTPIHV